jgi:hypothetical protein
MKREFTVDIFDRNSFPGVENCIFRAGQNHYICYGTRLQTCE